MVVEVLADPPSRTWWEACTLGPFELVKFALVPRAGGSAAATATFRRMELVPTAMHAWSLGLIDVWVEEASRRRGLATFLLTEAFRQFIRDGTHEVEVQAMQHNLSAQALYRKMGFAAIRPGKRLPQGVNFRRVGPASLRAGPPKPIRKLPGGPAFATRPCPTLQGPQPLIDFLKIVILAVIQGLAELLPVSSSAHVIVAEKLMGKDPSSPRMTLLLVMLHTGTMFAVIVYFWRAWKTSIFASRDVFFKQAIPACRRLRADRLRLLLPSRSASKNWPICPRARSSRSSATSA